MTYEEQDLEQGIRDALSALGIGGQQHPSLCDVQMDCARDALREALGLYPQLDAADLSEHVEVHDLGGRLARVTVTHTPSAISAADEAGDELAARALAYNALRRRLGNLAIEHVAHEQPGTFMAMAIAGMTAPDDVDHWVERWHLHGDDGRTLAEFLGLTDHELARIVDDPRCAQLVVEERRCAVIASKLGRPAQAALPAF